MRQLRPIPAGQNTPLHFTSLTIALDNLLVWAFTIATVFVGGRLYLVFGPASSTISFATIAASIAIAAALRLLEGEFLIVGTSVSIVTYFSFAIYLFSWRFDRIPNLNALGPYLPLASGVIYYPLFRRGQGAQIVTAILCVTTVYAALYAIGSALQDSPLQSLFGGLLITDRPGGRADRLLAASAALSAGSAIWLVKVRTKLSIVGIAAVLLFAWDIYSSGSRFYQAAWAILMMFYLTVGRTRPCGAISFAVLVLLSIVVIMPVFKLANPFAWISTDSSAYVRAVSTEQASRFVQKYWGLGIGLPSNPDDNVWAMSSKAFFSADLGSLGILFNHGIIGIIFFFALSALVSFSTPMLENLSAHPDDLLGVQLAGSICVLQGGIATVLWNGSGAFLSGVFIAAMLAAVAAHARQNARPKVEFSRS